ncbi:hypothetical protein Nepgr_007258 [Nepenthes gracilis]|uniref:Helicase-like transcription factor CHR28 n=1 Tax=Nepenthes gracilis TaxID=150966 RepID=A0AAD3S6H6_NEPGR|nr:hypothetical protein Nepgr_007258 [Nepenthes gracilis]
MVCVDVMADQTSNFWASGDSSNDDVSDDVLLDLDELGEILEEPPDASKGNLRNPFTVSVSEDGAALNFGNHENSIFQIDSPRAFAVDKLNATIGEYGTSRENSAEKTNILEQPSFTSPAEISLIAINGKSSSGNSPDSGLSGVSGFVTLGSNSVDRICWNENDIVSAFLNSSLPDSANYQLMSSSGEILTDMEHEIYSPQPADLCLDNDVISEPQVGGTDAVVSGASMFDLFNERRLHFIYEDSHSGWPFVVNSYSGNNITDQASEQSLLWTQSTDSSEEQPIEIGDKGNAQLFLRNGVRCQSPEAKNEAALRKFPIGHSVTDFDENTVAKTERKSLVISKVEGEDEFLESTKAHDFVDIISVPHPQCHIPTIVDKSLHMRPCLKSLPSLHIPASYEKSGFKKDRKEDTTMLPQPAGLKSGFLDAIPEARQANLLDKRNDDKPDICIIEDADSPGRRVASSLAHSSSLVTLRRPICSASPHHIGVNGMRPEATNERLVFRAALQDLSQPTIEATPPDGVLAVPLLRHQRIALSWMVQKETASWQCSGGILADDQGLGKTISTIALILKERPSLARISKDAEQCKQETLYLDGGGDRVPESDILKKNSEQLPRNVISVESGATSLTKGRPAAGTLIVCPTSVLRQWAQELHSKVTSKANLSILVYHGSNRTKDPYELAKYDVVITTYSIVSMEVLKQQLNGKEKGKPESDNLPPLSSSRKRKYSPSSGTKLLQRGMDKSVHESVACPLARAGWFRVVLDEAQSIKNHRTRVAQACWGLRAKRRWCLSGTPIQNSVDDLYSYFRFLRYDPYAVYKSFCSMVKVPISKNPANGYRKLQAVLKTVMLRRTKGTLIDGEPIITLPPKYVNLKKVEFSKEEWDFYSKLEADSRAQFAVYEANDTVQENYVNILLMLLRLRQACDHPLLVQGYGSSFVWKSSLDTANKLPREKQLFLLNCLEASLAICGICRDPPEDSVVSICGHVFCNQCIHEHLTGDESQCPVMNCKVQLCVSSVFSRATLKNCLSDEAGQDHSVNSSGSESSNCSKMAEPFPGGRCLDSSKIKAVLEVLHSLNKPHDFILENGDVKSTGSEASCSNSLDAAPGAAVTYIPTVNGSSDSDMKKCLSNSVSVVKEKAIVFSQWTRMLDLLEACLRESSIQYRRLDGTMSVVARDKAVRDFNTLPEVSVIIMSLKAASLGLNMVAACHVLLLDLWWNPTTEDQAIDRAHRIGQTRPVTVLRLTVKDTVEDRILALQQRKRVMVASAFGEDGSGSRETRLTADDLRYLFSSF